MIYQVYPSRIEGILHKHPLVKDCGVLGTLNSVGKEVTIVFVVTDDSSLSQDNIFDFLHERCSLNCRLEGSVKFVDPEKSSRKSYS